MGHFLWRSNFLPRII